MDEENINKSSGNTDHENQCGSQVSRIVVHMECVGRGKYPICINMYIYFLYVVSLGYTQYHYFDLTDYNLVSLNRKKALEGVSG